MGLKEKVSRGLKPQARAGGNARVEALAYLKSQHEATEERRIRSTTVICVRRGDRVVMAADGQVSMGATVMKGSAKKIRRLYNDKVLAGFAGSTADAFSLVQPV